MKTNLVTDAEREAQIRHELIEHYDDGGIVRETDMAVVLRLLDEARAENAWLRRVIGWCRPRLKNVPYQTTLDIRLAAGPTEIDPDEPKVSASESAPPGGSATERVNMAYREAKDEGERLGAQHGWSVGAIKLHIEHRRAEFFLPRAIEQVEREAFNRGQEDERSLRMELVKNELRALRVERDAIERETWYRAIEAAVSEAERETNDHLAARPPLIRALRALADREPQR